MSTRATYRLPADNDDEGHVYVYIHYDGYPSGAAVYFARMHDETARIYCRGRAEAFIRHNELAEITRSHEWHPDTEYRYNLDASGELTAYEFTGGKWRPFFEGPVRTFVDEHAPGLLRDVRYLTGYDFETMPRTLEGLRLELAALDMRAEHCRVYRYDERRAALLDAIASFPNT